MRTIWHILYFSLRNWWYYQKQQPLLGEDTIILAAKINGLYKNDQDKEQLRIKVQHEIDRIYLYSLGLDLDPGVKLHPWIYLTDPQKFLIDQVILKGHTVYLR